MADDAMVRRAAANAAAIGVELDAAAAERVAGAVGPVLTRFAQTNLQLAMEVEPSTFVAVQRRDRAS
jgi:hypothetical protein